MEGVEEQHVDSHLINDTAAKARALVGSSDIKASGPAFKESGCFPCAHEEESSSSVGLVHELERFAPILSSIGTYTCRKNELVSKVSKKLGCNINELIWLNKSQFPDLYRGTRLPEEATLQVPMSATCKKDGSIFSAPNSHGAARSSGSDSDPDEAQLEYSESDSESSDSESESKSDSDSESLSEQCSSSESGSESHSSLSDPTHDMSESSSESESESESDIELDLKSASNSNSESTSESTSDSEPQPDMLDSDRSRKPGFHSSNNETDQDMTALQKLCDRLRNMQNRVQTARNWARDTRRRGHSNTVVPPRLSIKTLSFPPLHQDSSPESILELFRERFVRLSLESRQAAAAAHTIATAAAVAEKAVLAEKIKLREEESKYLREKFSKVSGCDVKSGPWASDPRWLRMKIDDARSLSGVHAATYYERSRAWTTVTPEASRPPWRLAISIRPPHTFYANEFGPDHSFPISVELRDALDRLVTTREPIPLQVEAMMMNEQIELTSKSKHSNPEEREKDKKLKLEQEQVFNKRMTIYWNSHDYSASAHWKLHKRRRAVRQKKSIEHFLEKWHSHRVVSVMQKKIFEEKREAELYTKNKHDQSEDIGENFNQNWQPGSKKCDYVANRKDVSTFIVNLQRRNPSSYPTPVKGRWSVGLKAASYDYSAALPHLEPVTCKPRPMNHCVYLVGGIASWRIRLNGHPSSLHEGPSPLKIQLKIRPCLDETYFEPEFDNYIANITAKSPLSPSETVRGMISRFMSSTTMPSHAEIFALALLCASRRSMKRADIQHDGLAVELEERRLVCHYLDSKDYLLTRPVNVVCGEKVPTTHLLLYQTYQKIGGVSELYYHPADTPEDANIFVEDLYYQLEINFKSILFRTIIEYDLAAFHDDVYKTFKEILPNLSSDARAKVVSSIEQLLNGLLPKSTTVCLAQPESCLGEALKSLKSSGFEISGMYTAENKNGNSRFYHSSSLSNTSVYLQRKRSLHGYSVCTDDSVQDTDGCSSVRQIRHTFQTPVQKHCRALAEASIHVTEASMRAAQWAALAELQYDECKSLYNTGGENMLERMRKHFGNVSMSDKLERSLNLRMIIMKLNEENQNQNDFSDSNKNRRIQPAEISEAARQLSSSIVNSTLAPRKFERPYKSHLSQGLNLEGTDIIASLAGGTYTSSEGDHEFTFSDDMPPGSRDDFFASLTYLQTEISNLKNGDISGPSSHVHGVSANRGVITKDWVDIFFGQKGHEARTACASTSIGRFVDPCSSQTPEIISDQVDDIFIQAAISPFSLPHTSNERVYEAPKESTLLRPKIIMTNALDGANAAYDLLKMKGDGAHGVLSNNHQMVGSGSVKSALGNQIDVIQPTLQSPHDIVMKLLDGGRSASLRKQWLALGVCAIDEPADSLNHTNQCKNDLKLSEPNCCSSITKFDRSLNSCSEIVNVFILAPKNLISDFSHFEVTLDDVVTFVPMRCSKDGVRGGYSVQKERVLKEIVQNRIWYPPPLQFRSVDDCDFNFEAYQTLETRRVHTFNMHKRWNAQISRAISPTSEPIKASYKKLGATGSIATGFFIHDVTRSSCLLELRRLVLQEYMRELQHQEEFKIRKLLDTYSLSPTHEDDLTSVSGNYNFGSSKKRKIRCNSSLNSESEKGTKKYRQDKDEDYKNTMKVYNPTFESINLYEWQTAQEYCFLLQDNNPGLLRICSRVSFTGFFPIYFLKIH